MERTIKTLIVVLLTVVSFVVVQTALADDFTVTGKIVEADRLSSTIVIEDENLDLVAIQGFPFHNLEVQLEEELGEPITIDEGDCVAIEYYVKYDEVNKWLSLTMYCDECAYCNEDLECTGDLCFEDDLERKSQRNNRPDPPAGPWNGKPPGFRHRP